MHVEIDIPESHNQLAIPPLALQMLIENAIKHNVISSDNPLNIRIYTNNSHLIVENNLKEKIDKEPSTGVGLSNIKDRYLFLTGKEIVILIENNKFIVKLPLTEEVK
jgi:LytS/YehU family sensor histidine kinase